MFHFRCKLCRGNSDKITLPAMVSVCTITYSEERMAALFTCPDGSCLVRSMSAENFCSFINDISMSFAGTTLTYVSLEHLGPLSRIPSVDEAVTLHGADL